MCYGQNDESKKRKFLRIKTEWIHEQNLSLRNKKNQQIIL